MICKACAGTAETDNLLRQGCGTDREDWHPAHHPCDNPAGCTCQHNKLPVALTAEEMARRARQSVTPWSTPIA